MPAKKNKLTIKKAPKQILDIKKKNIAVGMRIADLQHNLQLKADEDAPHFIPKNEPIKDRTAYTSVAGKKYFRPELIVALRESDQGGPDVWFLMDVDGSVRLQFELAEDRPSGIPSQADPFNIRIEHVKLMWKKDNRKREYIFSAPTFIAEDEGNDPQKPDFYIRIGAELSSDVVEDIHMAMTTTNCNPILEVVYKYGYWLDKTEDSGSSSGSAPRPPIIPLPKPPIIPTPKPPQKKPLSPVGGVIHPDIRSIPRGIAFPRSGPTLRVGLVTRLDRRAMEVPKTLLRDLKVIDKKAIEAIKKKAQQRKQSSNFKERTVSRKINFYFDPALAQNKHIYRAIRGDDTFIAEWTDTACGMVKKSSFANTVYRVPDEIRLAYNAELGTAHVIPHIYRDDDEEIRVRVTLRVLPWNDSDNVIKLRRELEKASAGSLINPTIIVGGYEEAKLKLTSAFPEEISSISGDEIEISLETGVDLNLDVSLEFYRYLAQLLTNPVGLVGEVTIVLESKKVEEEIIKTIRRVPVRLTLDDMVNFPVEIKVEQEVLSPKEVNLVSRVQDDIKISECAIRLLQWDNNSIYPLDVIEAETDSPFPATLSQSVPHPIAIKLKDGEQEVFWNAVQVDLVGHDLLKTPTEVLEKIHEIAPAGSLSWEITVECPLFLNQNIPEKYQNLYSIEIKISRAGYAVQQIILKRDTPTVTITMQRRLEEIIASDAEGLETFSYQVQNIYYDHKGKWSEATSSQGSNLFVFPNPVEND